MRKLGFSITLEQPWDKALAENRLALFTAYTMRPQDQHLETLTIDFYYCPTPLNTDEVDASAWRRKGAVHIARVTGYDRRRGTPATISGETVFTINLPAGGDYIYTLTGYRLSGSLDARTFETAEALQSWLKSTQNVLHTFSPQSE